MSDSGNLNQGLGSKRQRLTKARKAIVGLLAEAGCALSANEISAALLNAGIKVDKSTVYRQLGFLESELVVRAVQFNERQKRFEVAGARHHHHVVCLGCRAVEEIPCHAAIVGQEEGIARDMDFKVLRHSLEFFGLCAKCQ